MASRCSSRGPAIYICQVLCQKRWKKNEKGWKRNNTGSIELTIFIDAYDCKRFKVRNQVQKKVFGLQQLCTGHLRHCALRVTFARVSMSIYKWSVHTIFKTYSIILPKSHTERIGKRWKGHHNNGQQSTKTSLETPSLCVRAPHGGHVVLERPEPYCRCKLLQVSWPAPPLHMDVATESLRPTHFDGVVDLP